MLGFRKSWKINSLLCHFYKRKFFNFNSFKFTAPIEEFPIERFQGIIEVCLMSNFYTIRETLGKMRKNNWGRIINIASGRDRKKSSKILLKDCHSKYCSTRSFFLILKAHGQVGSKHKSAYCSAKHGVIGKLKTLLFWVL